jgi:hypothetical protein
VGLSVTHSPRHGRRPARQLSEQVLAGHTKKKPADKGARCARAEYTTEADHRTNLGGDRADGAPIGQKRDDRHAHHCFSPCRRFCALHSSSFGGSRSDPMNCLSAQERADVADSRVGLSSVPHAAPALIPHSSPKGPGPSDVTLVPSAKAAQWDTRQEAAGAIGQGPAGLGGRGRCPNRRKIFQSYSGRGRNGRKTAVKSRKEHAFQAHHTGSDLPAGAVPEASTNR